MALMLGAALLPAMAEAKDKIPGEKDLKALALESLMEFNQSVQAKDFTSFHQYISELWRKQITAQELQDTFQAFIDQKIDLSPIKNLDPVFDLPAAITGEGWLQVIGHYPSRPSNVAFMLDYVQEGGKWKVAGVNIQIYPPEKMVPFDPILQKLARETMLEFSKAVKAADFTAFHKSISIAWRQQTTPEELKEAFQSFIDIKADLSGVAKVDAVIDAGASIDEDGMLSFSGHFPLKSNKLIFSLKYILEDGSWKLASINVKM
jgi:Ca2+-binding EF-hand superfamily protein